MNNHYITIGKLCSPHGLQGWIKIASHTSPLTNIVDYKPWLIKTANGWHPLDVDDIHIDDASHILAHIKNVNDPESAKLYTNKTIGVSRSALPSLTNHEFYWADLIGMTVINESSELLGTVDHLMETGSNDVLVVVGKKRHLIPFIRNRVISHIDAEKKIITVNWDTEF
ncbi:MAG: 16S rRNA processing protein RimM [Gammaproteobacteria bacterium GWF2_41_13]|nr:MAG: 16S rRNA processing protein RimM [Gammaproteobacteria bacterium GWF2_41_13]